MIAQIISELKEVAAVATEDAAPASDIDMMVRRLETL